MECDLDSDMPLERKPPVISINDVEILQDLSQSREGSSYSRYRNDPSQSLFDNCDSPLSASHNNEPGDFSEGSWSGGQSQQAFNLNHKNKFAKKKKK